MSKIWKYISHIGVSDDEIHSKREVILLNKMISMACILVILFIPIEIALNGFKLVPYELLAALIFCTILVFNANRMYLVAKYLTILLGVFLITFSTLAVGGNSNSEFNLLPIMLLPLVFFHKMKHILPLVIFVAIAFFLLKFQADTFPPIVEVSDEVKSQVQPIMNLMTMVFLFFELYYFKNLNQNYEQLLHEKNRQIEHAHRELSQHHREIQDSISYAKRIQEAIMPSMSHVHAVLKDVFVLYLPKDVVAGDFFWLEEMGGTTYFAVADCTGHGVPGAMVSVVCSTALTKALLEEGVRDTGKILDRTKELVTNQLAKSGEDVKDGMDISLCALGPTVSSDGGAHRVLSWSGANNPLWIARKGAEEIEEIKGDKQPVGKYALSNPFNSHSIQLNPGDSIYAFTDGFHDQFGGERGKKFKAKALRAILLSLQSTPMEKQGTHLKEAFDLWKGSLEQVDDVCVIGVRV